MVTILKKFNSYRNFLKIRLKFNSDNNVHIMRLVHQEKQKDKKN